MKFSFNWLKDYIDLKEAPEKLAEIISDNAFEIKEIIKDGGDVIFDIDILPNRVADVSGHWGLARELGAILNRKLKQNFLPSKLGVAKKARLSIKIVDINGCSFYSGKMMNNVAVKASPVFIQRRLKSVGLQPICNVVDIANYVMLELGQPLHVFDADKLIKGIVVRRAKQREHFETIDGVKLSLTKEDLVIADYRKAVALAGIKGGMNTAVSPQTKNILIESANFNSAVIYEASKRHSLMTDAALRFSAGLHPHLALTALQRAAELIKKYANGNESSFVFDGGLPLTQKVLLRTARVKELLGLELDRKQIESILRRLYFGITYTKNDFMLAPPLYRQDINIEEDVIEEIGRLYGFNKIKSEVPFAPLGSAQEEELETFVEKLRDYLVRFNFKETYGYAFISHKAAKELLDKSEQEKAVKLLNPVSAHFEYFRPNLFFGLCSAVSKNQKLEERLQFFEVGNIAHRERRGVYEQSTIGMIMASNEKTSELFYELKGYLDSLFKALGIADIVFKEKGKNSAEVVVREEKIGLLQIMGAGFKKFFDIELNLVGCELSVNALYALQREETDFKTLPKYPAVIRDIAILVKRGTRVAEVMNIMENSGARHVEDIDLFDVFEPTPSDREEPKLSDTESLAFHIIFRAENKTLTDAEVNSEFEKIKKALVVNLGATIR